MLIHHAVQQQIVMSTCPGSEAPCLLVKQDNDKFI